MADGLGRGRARGRGRGLAIDGSSSLGSGGSSGLGSDQLAQPVGRAQFLHPVPELPMGRAHTVFPTTVGSSDTGSTSAAGRGGHLVGSDSSAKVAADIVARPDNKRGALRLRRERNEIYRTRPVDTATKEGTTGQPITLQANYFRFKRLPDWQIYRYRVDFEPEILSEKVRKELIWLQKEMLGGYLFDGEQLFLTRKLESDTVQNSITDRTNTTYVVSIKFTGEVSMSESTSLQILNLILRRSMDGLNLKLVGRNFFDPDAKTAIPEFRLELWPGYITSIRQHEEDILVCVEIAHKVMRTETIYDIMNRVRREERDFKTAIMERILGGTVLTAYNNNTYRIDDIDFEKSPSSTFETKNGPISFIEYYKSRYNIVIKDAKQPLIVSKSKERDLRGGKEETILLVPELCRATGITDDMRKNFKTMKAMAEHTKMGPPARIQKLLMFSKRIEETQRAKPVLSDWNLKLDTELVTLKGRLLPFENIVFGNDRKMKQDARVDWTAGFRNNSMFSSIPLKRWYVLFDQRASKETADFVALIKEVSRGMRFEVGEPRFVGLADDRQTTLTQELERCCNDNPQLIMCVVPNNNADRYSNIKKKCCVQHAVPTQVMVQRTITPKGGNTRGLMSVATKVAIQMNCKLGGLPWMIEMPVKGLLTMGFDVCHDPKDKRKSYGALVAAMNLKTSPEFFSAVQPHTNGEELSNQLALDIVKAIKQYRDVNNALPEKICMFRDGVGDGQIEFVVEHELSAINAQLKEIYQNAGYEEVPKFIFIIVSKRINTRFFANNANPVPGTVVDSVVTLPERYDFYLVSQSVREGTNAPTSFNVVYDTFGMPPDRVQMLTYKFMYLYFNWSGTVRVPALCQYAHKLAFLVSQSLHQRPSNDLEKKLYFL